MGNENSPWLTVSVVGIVAFLAVFVVLQQSSTHQLPPSPAKNLGGQAYASTDSVPAGYASPWDGRAGSPIQSYMKVDVATGTNTQINVSITKGTGVTKQYIYTSLYLYNGTGGWVQYNISNSQEWIANASNSTITISTPNSPREAVVIAYICKKYSTDPNWYCGDNNDETVQKWTIQNLTIGAVPPECATGDKKCSGTQIQTCTAGVWGTAANCPSGQSCTGTAPSAACTPVAETCFDGLKNQQESDVDCGGSGCAKCENGGRCTIAANCEFDNCYNGFCTSPFTCNATTGQVCRITGGPEYTTTGVVPGTNPCESTLICYKCASGYGFDSTTKACKKSCTTTTVVADCGDNNECTTETCVNNFCSSSSATDGTTCTTGGTAGKCTAGTCYTCTNPNICARATPTGGSATPGSLTCPNAGTAIQQCYTCPAGSTYDAGTNSCNAPQCTADPTQFCSSMDFTKTNAAVAGVGSCTSGVCTKCTTGFTKDSHTFPFTFCKQCDDNTRACNPAGNDPAAYKTCAYDSQSNRYWADMSWCTESMHCASNACVQYCTSPADCRKSETCNNISGRCEPMPCSASNIGATYCQNNGAGFQVKSCTASGWSSWNNCPTGDTCNSGFTACSSGGGAPNKVVTPTLNPTGGTVNIGSTVTISSSTNGATIYYRLDGSDPILPATCGNAPTSPTIKYTVPITINSATTLNAKACNTGMTSSDVATGTYSIVASCDNCVQGETYCDEYNEQYSECIYEGGCWTMQIVAYGSNYYDYCW